MPQHQDPAASLPAIPFHPSEPSAGLVTAAVGVMPVLAAFAFLLRAA